MSATRRSLHAVAEQLLAGPQHRTQGTIRLRVTPGGFGQVAGPWRVEGGELVGPDVRVPLTGTVAEVGEAAGVEPGAPSIYSDHADLADDAPLAVDAAAAARSRTGSPAATRGCARSRPTRNRCCGRSTSTSASPSTR